MAPVTESGGARRRWPVLVACAALVAATSGCLFSDPEVCRALRDAPEGLEEISTQGGSATEDASWLAVLTTGVLAADPASRDEVAAAVTADADGFRRVLDAAPEVATELELLHGLAADPALGAAMSSAPDTLVAVTALTAHVDEACD